MQTESKKRMNLPIDIAHGIEEYTGVSSRVNNYAIHRYMPTLFIGVMVVDVPPPSGKTVIAFPDEKHLPGKMCKIRIVLELGVKFCGGLLPERAPRGHNAKGNGEVNGNVIERRHVKNAITLSVTHYKFTFQALHLNLTDRTDEREGSQAAQRNG
jgi:hypothetical protein